jgi:mono/diheme cytochrome c family protein
MKSNYLSSVVAALVSLALASCGAGDGSHLDETGKPLSQEEQPAQGPADPDQTSDAFTRIQNEILTPECATSGCHNGTSSPLGLNLIEGKAYKKLVGTKSNQVDGLQLVEPSNALASYLLHKVEGTQSGGQQMPLGKPPLSSEKIKLIKEWINNGALQAASPSKEKDNTDIQATLSDIQKKIFNSDCITCHKGENPAGALNLEPGKSYAQLVGRALQFDPDNSILVVAGSSNDSFLINKLNGTNLGSKNSADYKGQKMPLLGPYLNSQKIQVISDWINAGAANN